MSELVTYELNDGIAVLTLNNGKVNALSPEVIVALNEALDRAQEAGAIVVLTGQPGILSGGYDLKVMMKGPEQAIALVTAGSALTRRMLAHPQPIIVACGGHAVAKGAFLLLASDYRLGVEGEFLIGLNEVQIGMTMHHVGILAGTALLVGVWGNLALYIVGLALSIPLLRRLRRRFGSLWAPAIGVAVFTSMFAISAFVVGPALTSGSPAGPSTVAPTDVDPSHAGHHR